MIALHVIAEILLLAMVIIHDRRIVELEQTQEDLMRRVARLARRQA